MSVYQVSGDTLTFNNDGNIQSGNIVVQNSWNPITGSSGPVEVRIRNGSTGNIATVSWIKEDVTYQYPNVTGTASGSGANATFDVTVAISNYIVSLVNAGDGYIATETIVITGDNLGGATPDNDLTVTVDTVGTGGNITNISISGTQAWPQGGVQTITTLPNSVDFVQVNNSAADTYFMSLCNDGELTITPVNVL